MDPETFEALRAELVEGLPHLVNRVIRGGKAEAQSAIDQIEQIRAILTGAVDLADFRDDLDAAERVLLVYLLT